MKRIRKMIDRIPFGAMRRPWALELAGVLALMLGGWLTWPPLAMFIGGAYLVLVAQGGEE